MSNNFKSYIFALCSPDSRFPNHRYWYLKIIEEDIDQLYDMYDLLMKMLNSKIGKDPHYERAMQEGEISLSTFLHNPVVLGLNWLSLALELMEKYKVVYISHTGTMFPSDPSKFIEHSTKSCPCIDFPTVDPKEFIYITKWKNGSHYYIQSSICRIFSKDKFDIFDEAYQEALKFVDTSRISVGKHNR